MLGLLGPTVRNSHCSNRLARTPQERPSAGSSGCCILRADRSPADCNSASARRLERWSLVRNRRVARALEIAVVYMRTLRDIFRSLEVSAARMEPGNIRADINVSLRPTPGSPLDTPSETKDVNSFSLNARTF